MQPARNFSFDEFYKTASLGSLSFSADQKKIYFLKTDGKVKNVFTFDISSKKISQITEYPENVNGFIQDPKGRYLFISKDIGGSELYDIFRFDLITKQSINLTNNPSQERSFLCDITNDGSKLYFTQSRGKRSFSDIKAIDVKSLKTTMVLDGGKDQINCEGLDWADSYLSFSRFIENNEIHIGLLNLKTKQKNFILQDKDVKNSGVGFDTAGNFFFLSTKYSDNSRLWKYELKTRATSLFPIEITGDIESAAISSKGKISMIAYRDSLKPALKIYDGVFEKEKTFPGINGEITSASFAKENPNLGILTINPGSAPNQFYYWNDSKPVMFYDSNQSKIEAKDFSKAYSTFVKSFDDLQIPVHLFLPPGTSATTKRPVIFWIHGGPEDHVDPEFSERIQYLGNQGFIIIAPNVRGSSGFGKKYSFLDNGDWGGNHIRDIVSIADWAKKLDFVDSNRVYIVGGSFGGFSVMSVITQYPKVFRAAVDVFGPIEMASFLASWPAPVIPYWISELGKDPRLDKTFNEKVSPFYHLANIAVPLQVHQGANDIRVPKAQSDLLVEKMKAMGKPVEYFVYDSEGHGFTKFENSKLCFTRMAEFFKSK